MKSIENVRNVVFW